MKRKQLPLLPILLLFMLVGCTQNPLVGTWQLVDQKSDAKDLNIKSSKVDPFGNENEEKAYEVFLQLEEDQTLYYIQGPVGVSKSTYLHKDTVLVLGNRTYYIQKLTHNELVMKDDDLYPKSYTYKRVSKKLEMPK